jgi:hypothetical protein
MIISYAGPAGRQVVMADANPGIAGLRAASALTLEEFLGTPGAIPAAHPARMPRPAPEPGDRPAPEPGGPRDGDAGRPAASGWGSGDDRPPPNLGPPPPRLDWRKRRS